MIEMRFQKIEVGAKTEPDFGTIMSKLSQILDTQKFYGNILIKFEAGKPRFITMDQRFTVDDFIKTLNI